MEKSISDPLAESRRVAILAGTIRNPSIRRKMGELSESWERMGRYDAVPVPQYQRD